MEIDQVAGYRFACTQCGDCCRGRQAVALNRQDLILLARQRTMANTAELFSDGLVEPIRDGNGHWRPYIRFKRRPIRMCPFLQNEVTETGIVTGKCTMHPHSKPLVCQLAPLGRVLELENQHEQRQLHEPSPGCPGMGKGDRRTIAADMAEFRERLDEEAKFFATLEQLSPLCNSPEAAITKLFSFAVPD